MYYGIFDALNQKEESINIQRMKNSVMCLYTYLFLSQYVCYWNSVHSGETYTYYKGRSKIMQVKLLLSHFLY